LETKMMAFNIKFQSFMNEKEIQDLDIRPQEDEDEDVDVDEEESEGDDDGGIIGDEHDDLEVPVEQMSLCLPSSLHHVERVRLGLQVLGDQEMELRKGQANDCLDNLRLQLAHTALLYRTRIRNAKTTKGKTRAWKVVGTSQSKVKMFARAYRRARTAMVHLGATREVLEKYQPLLLKDLKVNADITEENRYHQRDDALAWFWRMGGECQGQSGSWMEECE
jgi:hypothetical protein